MAPTVGPAPPLAHFPVVRRSRPPWITIAPPEATTSGAAVDHDRAVGWITTRAPLKHQRAPRRSIVPAPFVAFLRSGFVSTVPVRLIPIVSISSR